LGVTFGAALWATCAVLGVHVVFVAFPGLRLALQVAGGVYLLYVAIRLWRSSGAALVGRASSVSSWAAFRRGFLTNITNPKVALFFGSVFATSFPAAPSPILQASVVAMVMLNALCWHTLLAYLFSRERVRAAYCAHARRRQSHRIGHHGGLGTELAGGVTARGALSDLSCETRINPMIAGVSPPVEAPDSMLRSTKKGTKSADTTRRQHHNANA
jgi:threonine/homoserine/homoserine lactone efflux protein